MLNLFLTDWLPILLRNPEAQIFFTERTKKLRPIVSVSEVMQAHRERERERGGQGARWILFRFVLSADVSSGRDWLLPSPEVSWGSFCGGEPCESPVSVLVLLESVARESWKVARRAPAAGWWSHPIRRTTRAGGCERRSMLTMKSCGGWESYESRKRCVLTLRMIYGLISVASPTGKTGAPRSLWFAPWHSLVMFLFECCGSEWKRLWAWCNNSGCPGV